MCAKRKWCGGTNRGRRREISMAERGVQLPFFTACAPFFGKYENETARCLDKDISCRAPKRQGSRGFSAIQIIWSANFATSTFRTKNGCRQRRQLTSLWRDGPTSAATLTAHRRRRTARQGRPHRCGREVYPPRQRPFEPRAATTCAERVTP